MVNLREFGENLSKVNSSKIKKHFLIFFISVEKQKKYIITKMLIQWFINLSGKHEIEFPKPFGKFRFRIIGFIFLFYLFHYLLRLFLLFHKYKI